MMKHKTSALAALALLTAMSVAAAAQQTGGGADVTGVWIFEVETSAGSGSPTFTFKQEGDILTGKYDGTFGAADVKGAVKGQAIKFSFTVNAQGADVTMSYEGVVEGATMKGKMEAGDVASGTWTAKRRAASK